MSSHPFNQDAYIINSNNEGAVPSSLSQQSKYGSLSQRNQEERRNEKHLRYKDFDEEKRISPSPSSWDYDNELKGWKNEEELDHYTAEHPHTIRSYISWLVAMCRLDNIKSYTTTCPAFLFGNLSRSLQKPATLCLLSGFMACAIFLIMMTHFIDQRNCNNSSSNKGSSHFRSQPQSFASSTTQYDYIIVGGGPSGIIAATKLANALPSLQILLLESGTASQASVLRNLAQEHSHEPTLFSAMELNVVPGGDFRNDDVVGIEEDTRVSINKFDVPLLWSGVASSQGRRQRDIFEDKRLVVTNVSDSESYVLPSSSSSNHHWPIARTLLARGLGGSGLHNAMIYVRALSTDFDRWNLTNWQFERDLLPHYIALERYIDEHDTKDDEPSTITSFWEASEELKRDRIQQQHKWRGFNGPVTTVTAGSGTAAIGVDAVAPLFVQSALTSGVTKLAGPGFNDPEPRKRIGAGYYEFNIHNGVRDSIAHAMLGKRKSQQAGGLPLIPSNLHIQTGVTVTSILTSTTASTSSNDKVVRATGVKYVRIDTGTAQTSEEDQQFCLRKNDKNAEIILAAGAVLSPQLLYNSGIWKNGSVVDLPGVGQNLQDHPVVAVSFSISPSLALEATSVYTIGDELEDYTLAVAELERLDDLMNNSEAIKSSTTPRRRRINGRLGTMGSAGFTAGAFLKSPYSRGESPDIQLTVFPRQIEPHVVRLAQRSNDTKNAFFLRSKTMLVTVALLQPEARYQVIPSLILNEESEKAAKKGWKEKLMDSINSKTLESQMNQANPLARILNFRLPSIELPDDKSEYLTENDVKRLAWGIEQVRRIQKSKPLSEFTHDELSPGANVRGEALMDYVKANNLPNSHWSGSTKMGRADDEMAVLDEELRVRGVRGLRIVDAGVFPFVPNGNTHSTVCAVASRAVDLIVAGRE